MYIKIIPCYKHKFSNFHTSPRKSCRLWDKVKKFGRARRAVDDNIIRRTDTHSKCLALIASPLQKWLHERVSVLRYTCITCSMEKLTRPKLVRKFPAFYVTRKFITAFTRARHLSLSWDRSIQSLSPIPLSKIHFNSIPHLRPGLPSSLLPSGFPTKALFIHISTKRICQYESPIKWKCIMTESTIFWLPIILIYWMKT